jgi:hypothetical protein
MPCPSHPPWLHHSNYTWIRVQVMKSHKGSMLQTAIRLFCTFCKQDKNCGYFLNHIRAFVQ